MSGSVENVWSSRGRAVTNKLLSLIAVLLGVIALQQSGVMADAAPVQAQAPTPPNAAAQRLQMIQTLRSIEGKVDRLETALKSGLKVEVTSMPDVTIAE
jgi:hypothetical protein